MLRTPPLLVLLAATVCAGGTIEVKDSDGLRRATVAARPGDTIRLAAGVYAPGVAIANVSGEHGRPITIEGDADHPPIFEGGAEALHLSDCSYVVLRNLVCAGQSGNGINVDDGGTMETPAHHVVLENVVVRDTGPGDSRNPIKLSGVEAFVVRGCRTERWSGQAVDMVGCHRGVIESCTFVGREGEAAAQTGPQVKGGSSEITIRRCTFDHTARRAVNVGGATGERFFRPLGARYEAKNVTVEECVFVGSEAPLAFVGVDGAVVRFNTIYRPGKWVFRVLQESVGERFVPCRNVVFERNLVVFRREACPVPVNVGAHTAAETFVFRGNFWFCEDDPAKSRVSLPTVESGGVYGKDPRVTAGDLVPARGSAAAGYGHAALP